MLLPILLALLALANLPVSYAVTRVPVHRHNGTTNGAKAIVSARRKYNINSIKSAQPIPTDDRAFDLFYSCPVTIGTPGQTAQVVFQLLSISLTLSVIAEKQTVV